MQNRKLELEMARKLAAEKEKIAAAATIAAISLDDVLLQRPANNAGKHLPLSGGVGFPGMPPAAAAGSAMHVNPNRVRVAPVTPSMLGASRARDPRLARMQPPSNVAAQQQQQQFPHHQQQQQQQMHQMHQQHPMLNNMLPPPQRPAALAAMPQSNGGSGPAGNPFVNPFGTNTNSGDASVVAQPLPLQSSAASIQDQILADLEVQISRQPREAKQRIAHKNVSPSKNSSSSGRGSGGRNSSSSSKSSSTSSSRSQGASKSTSSASKSASSSRDRSGSDRNSGRNSDYNKSSSSSSSSRRPNNDAARKKSRTTSVSSSSSPSKKSPKRSSGTNDDVFGKSRSQSPSKQMAASTTTADGKGGSLADKYRSYLERNRDKSSSPTTMTAQMQATATPTAIHPDSSPADHQHPTTTSTMATDANIAAAQMLSETSKETKEPKTRRHIVITLPPIADDTNPTTRPNAWEHHQHQQHFASRSPPPSITAPFDRNTSNSYSSNSCSCCIYTIHTTINYDDDDAFVVCCLYACTIFALFEILKIKSNWFNCGDDARSGFVDILVRSLRCLV